MPYVKKDVREELEPHLESLEYWLALGDWEPGDLNYIVTRILVASTEGSGPLNYSAVNEIVGVLECAKLEFYRRMAAPYENKKRVENGDVYQ